MRRRVLVLLLLVAKRCSAFFLQSTFHHAPEERTADGVSRRAVVWSAAVALLAPTVASATTTTKGSVFVGRYTDPKHPGGYREITLLPGAQIGPYKLANVRGGQGVAEPEFWECPAFIVEKKDYKRITIDFSQPPKLGPPDFSGLWDPKKKGIQFVEDGNLWPKQKGK